MSERLRKIVVNVDFQRDGETVYQVDNSPHKRFGDMGIEFLYQVYSIKFKTLQAYDLLGLE